jgi:spore coat polysaccharide biosynthesis protein SpsF
MVIGIICQARSKSSRFPRKIWEPISGKVTLQRVLDGVAESKIAQKIVLAMPEYDKVEVLSAIGDETIFLPDERFEVFFGAEDDVLKRYYDTALQAKMDIIVRVTCDCPLINGKLIDHMLIEYTSEDYNGFMGCNGLVSPVPYPSGVDCDIFKWNMLAETHMKAKGKSCREHVTPYMYRSGSQYKIHPFLNKTPNPIISNAIKDISFDTEEDLRMLDRIAGRFDELVASGLDTISSLDVAIKEFDDENSGIL